MKRLLTFIAISLLIGSAVYAYRVKYDSIVLAEQVAKLKSRIHREKDAIAVLKAEWQYVNRPDRVQALADAHTDLKPMSVHQVVRWSELPARQAPTDAIAGKLEALGLLETTGSTAKPSDSKKSGGPAQAGAASAPAPAKTGAPR
jgi:hypothetical protein